MLELIQSEIRNRNVFLIQPPRGNSRKIAFLESSKISDPSGELNSYEFVIDNESLDGIVHLKLFSEKGLVAICKLDSSGILKGRDRHTVGYFTIIPENIDFWKKLARPLSTVIDGGIEFQYEEVLPPQIDWAPFQFNLAKEIDPKKYESDVAIALVAFNRPSYFSKVVQSIANNELSRKIPVFAFFDFCPDHPFFVDEQVKTLKDHLPHAVAIRRPRNFGCGRNIIDVRRQMFDHMGYDKVFVMEDDLIVSPNYLQLCLNLLEWSKKYSNVGVVQGWNSNFDDEEKCKTEQNVVIGTWDNLWGYLMTKKCWDAIKEDIYKYEDLFLGGEYRFRPHRSIHKWFRTKLTKKVENDGCFPTTAEYDLQRQKYLDSPPTGQDAATAILMEIHGFTRIATKVSRGRYIGKEGIHMNFNRWIKMKYDQMTTVHFENDDSLTEFQLMA